MFLLLAHIQFWVYAGWGGKSVVEPLLNLYKSLGSAPKAKSKIVCTVTYILSGSDVAAKLFTNTKRFWMLEIIHLPIFQMLCLI